MALPRGPKGNQSMTIKTLFASAVLTLAFAVAPAYAKDLVFTLNNQSSGAVNELYVSPLDSNNWEEDILGKDLLDSGQTATITIRNADGQCQWDVRIVYDDGSVTDERNIDLCNLENGTYDVTD
jgi:hypothetical protein